MAFLNTLREGLESVVFLTGVSAGTDPRSIPLAGIVGIILGIIVGIALYYTCATLLSSSFRQMYLLTEKKLEQPMPRRA